METKKLIIIGVLAVIICVLAGAIFGVLTNSVDYERIEVVPNGTSIEIPKNNASYYGELNETGTKMWTFKQGCLLSYNVNEAFNGRGIYALAGAIGLKDIQDMIINHYDKVETIDNYKVYTVDGEKIDVPSRDTLYCILVSNNDTGDVILIATDNLDISLHMAKSIQFKNTNISTTTNASYSSNSVNTNTSGLSQSDLDKARQEGYDSGYMDGYDDSYYDEYEDDFSINDVETTADTSSKASSDSSSSSSSDAESTVSD